MPCICRFYGIAIYMYFADHPPSHFHALYSGQEAVISIENLVVLNGSLPPRAAALVLEWAMQHRDDLRRAWEQAREHEPIDPIEPLS